MQVAGIAVCTDNIRAIDVTTNRRCDTDCKHKGREPGQRAAVAVTCSHAPLERHQAKDDSDEWHNGQCREQPR